MTAQIEVKPGQWVVYRDRWGESAVRADKVTDKQIRTRKPWGKDRYNQTSRSSVLVAVDTEQQAREIVEAISKARKARHQAERDADDAFEIATRPAAKIRDDAKDAASEAEAEAIRKIVEAT